MSNHSHGAVADTPTDDSRTVYGGSIGLTGRVVGFEVDLGLCQLVIGVGQLFSAVLEVLPGLPLLLGKGGSALVDIPLGLIHLLFGLGV